METEEAVSNQRTESCPSKQRELLAPGGEENQGPQLPGILQRTGRLSLPLSSALTHPRECHQGRRGLEAAGGQEAAQAVVAVSPGPAATPQPPRSGARPSAGGFCPGPLSEDYHGDG